MQRLIDADAFRKGMYHEAFETDSDLQKWDSGCWIRWKMLENHLQEAPTVDAVPVKHGRWMTYKYDEKQYRNVIVPWDGKGIPNNIFCSECSTPALLNGHEEDVDSNYCPKCGAKMDLEDEQ